VIWTLKKLVAVLRLAVPYTDIILNGSGCIIGLPGQSERDTVY